MANVTTLIEQAIAMYGTEAKLAAAVGCSQPAINIAKRRGGVGAEMAIAIHRATDGRVAKWKLRPDLWTPSDSTPRKSARRAGRSA